MALSFGRIVAVDRTIKIREFQRFENVGFFYGYAVGSENISNSVVNYLLRLGGVVVGAGAEKIVDIRKRA